jgi:hypothetical protein
MLDSLSIRQSHSANGQRCAGPIGRMPDLKLPLLAPFMTASKHAEDFTRKNDTCRREKVRSMVRLLSRWSSWNQLSSLTTRHSRCMNWFIV